jgi:hypothetical protein
VRIFALLLGITVQLDDFFESCFLGRVALSSGAGLVTLHVVSRQENTVTGQDFTRLDERDVSDSNFLQ